MYWIIKRWQSFGESLACNSEEPIKCLSLDNRPCHARPTLVSINSYEPLWYPFTVSVNKCVGNCNTIDGLYARVCVPDKVKHMNVKEFNLMSRVKETLSITSEWIVSV